MASIQFDYSTLSTSISRSELSSIVCRHIVENDYDINEESVSERSSQSSEIHVLPSPTDKYKLVYLTFGILGISSLLPWNFFITANDYWMYKFRDTVNQSCSNHHNKTDLQAAFTSYLAVANNVPYVIFLIICMVFNNKFSKTFHVIISLFVLFILFTTLTAFVEVDTDDWQIGFLILTLGTVVAVGVVNGILQAGSAGVASMLPAKYMHIMVLGQAVAGIIASVAQILSLLGHCDSIKSALIYFFFADVMILIALISYFSIQKSEFFKYHTSLVKSLNILKEVPEIDIKPRISISLMYKLIWPYALTILFNFWVTIGVFPGLSVLSVPQSKGTFWDGKLYLPVCCFFLLNLSDFCGRAVAGWLPLPSTRRILLLILCCFRIVFIPLFMLCNLHPRNSLPVWFLEDSYYVSFITLLGFTNGYFLTVAMLNCLKSVNPVLQEMAGIILSAFLGAGLMLGAITSYALIQII